MEEYIFHYMTLDIQQKLTPPVLLFSDFAGWVKLLLCITKGL